MVSPTNEQIIAEAKRRADFRKWTGAPIEYFIIEVVRENWTPAGLAQTPHWLIG